MNRAMAADAAQTRSTISSDNTSGCPLAVAFILMPPAEKPCSSQFWSAFYCEETPFARDSPEGVDPAILKGQPRTRHQIPHSAGDEYFAWPSEGRDTRPDVKGDPCQLVAHCFTLARMQACSNLDPERAHTL
jgi:hypothetical protein